jgi:hypothetical protein
MYIVNHRSMSVLVRLLQPTVTVLHRCVKLATHRGHRLFTRAIVAEEAEEAVSAQHRAVSNDHMNYS